MFRKLFFWALVPGGVNIEVVARVGWLLRGRAGSVRGAEPGAGRARPGVCRSWGDGLREGRSGLYNLQLGKGFSRHCYTLSPVVPSTRQVARWCVWEFDVPR